MQRIMKQIQTYSIIYVLTKGEDHMKRPLITGEKKKTYLLKFYKCDNIHFSMWYNYLLRCNPLNFTKNNHSRF